MHSAGSYGHLGAAQLKKYKHRELKPNTQTRITDIELSIKYKMIKPANESLKMHCKSRPKSINSSWIKTVCTGSFFYPFDLFWFHTIRTNYLDCKQLSKISLAQKKRRLAFYSKKGLFFLKEAAFNFGVWKSRSNCVCSLANYWRWIWFMHGVKHWVSNMRINNMWLGWLQSWFGLATTCLSSCSLIQISRRTSAAREYHKELNKCWKKQQMFVTSCIVHETRLDRDVSLLNLLSPRANKCWFPFFSKIMQINTLHHA